MALKQSKQRVQEVFKAYLDSKKTVEASRRECSNNLKRN
jgi:hypothetical protein